MSTRIGVVADTHSPEFAALPQRVLDVLSGVELILHAGDINERSTLDALGRIAPVVAVRGDHDRALADLPASREVTVAGKRVALVHGDRARWIEEPQTLLWTLSLGHYHPHGRLPRDLKRRFPDADVIVYGHTHRPDIRWIGDTLLFNPGGVHQWTRETTRRRLRERVGWFEWSWLQVARFIRTHPAPTVGLLEIDGEIRPKVVQL